jgi:hypothetical protein
MKQVTEQVYKKIQKRSSEVKQEFRRKGIVLPTKNTDGSITLGRYSVVKLQNSFYAIKDKTGDIVVDKINLPQTAALLANGLELGRWIDTQLLQKDRTYGYALFEETLYKRHAEKNMRKDADRAQVMLTKSGINRIKKETCKREILSSFEKLKKFV